MSLAEQSDPAVNEPAKIIRDATCTRCGCVCDDIDLTVQDNRIVAAERACVLGRPWFLDQRDVACPACLIDGQSATVAEGIERAARILAAAKYPIVYGLTETTCEAQRVAVSIADWIGASVDTVTSRSQGPIGMAFQGVGEVTCSLGEIANRGDLVIFWGSNPSETHPRHLEKYSLWPHGMFLPGGRADRTAVLVDVQRTETAASMDEFIQIKPNRDFVALWTLRALALDLPLDAADVERQTGVALSVWRELMERMKRAKFGVMLFGAGLAESVGKHLNIEALLALVRDMNSHTRFVAKSMRDGGNVVGADSVIAWQTGFPFSVNLSRAYPRFNPGEYASEQMLARSEADAALIVRSDPMAVFSPIAKSRLASIPRVVIGPTPGETGRGATVVFATATYGIHTHGTVYRMDDVPIPLRPALESPLPSDVEILSALEQRVRELTASGL